METTTEGRGVIERGAHSQRTSILGFKFGMIPPGTSAWVEATSQDIIRPKYLAVNAYAECFSIEACFIGIRPQRSFVAGECTRFKYGAPITVGTVQVAERVRMRVKNTSKVMAPFGAAMIGDILADDTPPRTTQPFVMPFFGGADPTYATPGVSSSPPKERWVDDLPIRFVHDAKIKAGAYEVIRVQSPTIFKCTRIVVPARLTSLFEINDVRVGCVSQFASVDPIPASVFHPEARTALYLSIAQVAQELMIGVTALSPLNDGFECEMRGFALVDSDFDMEAYRQMEFAE